MSKREEFLLTLEQCQRLAETSVIARMTFPKKWGEKAIPDEEHLIARDDIGALYKTLKCYSPWMQGVGQDYQNVFGNKDDWYPAGENGVRLEPIEKDGVRLPKVEEDDPRIHSWKFVDPLKVYRLRLGHEALSGVVWCCNYRLHPHTTMPLTIRDPIDLWWSIAAAVGKSAAVRKYIGLAAAKRIEWEDDPEETSKLPPPA